MSKYVCEVCKEDSSIYTGTKEEQLARDFDLISLYFDTQSTFKIGTKWFRVYESVNDLVNLEIPMDNRKEFLEYFKSKGRKFVKR